MNLDNVTAVLRARRSWEAVDLGVLLARACAGQVALAWLIGFAPFLAVALVLCAHHPLLFLFIAWWLRPIYGGAVITVLGHALFGELPRAGAIVAGWRSVLSWRRARTLTVLRLDPSRTVTDAVWQLEGLRGERASARARVLAGATTTLPVVASWALCEGALLVSAMVLASWLTPDAWWHWNEAGEIPLTIAWIAAGIYVGVSALVEALLAASGFALYINRRVQLEGWDVEIAFRRISTRLAGAARSAVIVLAIVGAAAAVSVVRAQDARPVPAEASPDGTAATSGDATSGDATDADEDADGDVAADATGDGTAAPAAKAEPAAPLDPNSPDGIARAVLDGPDFHRRREIRTWRLREAPKPDQPQRAPSSPWLGELLAAVARPMLWIVGIGAVFAIVYTFVRSRSGDRGERFDAGDAPPLSVAGLDVRPESLPLDVAAVAESWWRAGRRMDAVSLLYRAVLATLVQRGADLSASSTERECLRAGQRLLTGEAGAYLARLTLAWQSLAYAHRDLAEDDGPSLCDEWRAHFGAAAAQEVSP